jgi:hypothetical protein
MTVFPLGTGCSICGGVAHIGAQLGIFVPPAATGAIISTPIDNLTF